MLWNRRRALLLTLVTPLVLAATGCVQQPSIAIHHVEPRGVSTAGLNLGIVLQVRNDNAYDVQIRGVRCNVYFGRGVALGPIDVAPNQWLPAGRVTQIVVPVSVPWTLVPALASESGNYGVPYRIRGVADVTAGRSLGIERNNYPIDEGGFIPRQMMVDAARGAMPFPLPF